MSPTSSKNPFLLCLTTILISVLTCGNLAQAGKNYQVFDVRRNLAMNAKDLVTRDYYVNAGTQDGLKAGMVLSVYRRDPIFDAYDDIRDDLYAPVGQIRLIHVQRTLSIARLVSVSKSTTSPIIDFRSVMIGDRIDLKSATMGDGGVEDMENSDREGAAEAAKNEGAAPAPGPAPKEATHAPAPVKDKSLKSDALVSHNELATPQDAPAKDTKSDGKKVPEGGSLFTEENKPTLNTQ